jgi:hypothetical protein
MICHCILYCFFFLLYKILLLWSYAWRGTSLAVDNKQKMIEEPTSYCYYLHHNISTKVYINDIICIASSFLALITVHWFFFSNSPPFNLSQAPPLLALPPGVQQPFARFRLPFGATTDQGRQPSAVTQWQNSTPFGATTGCHLQIFYPIISNVWTYAWSIKYRRKKTNCTVWLETTRQI